MWTHSKRDTYKKSDDVRKKDDGVGVLSSWALVIAVSMLIGGAIVYLAFPRPPAAETAPAAAPAVDMINRDSGSDVFPDAPNDVDTEPPAEEVRADPPPADPPAKEEPAVAPVERNDAPLEMHELVKDVIVECHTNKGSLRIHLHHEAPIGALRFLQMVDAGYFSTKNPFYRVVPGFVAQFGMAGDPKITGEWHAKPALKDDKQWLKNVGNKQKKPFKKGMLSFAGGSKNSRKIELFFALSDSGDLGKEPWEVPIGSVDEDSIAVLESLHSGYGDLANFGGHAPNHERMFREGSAFWETDFGELSYVEGCSRAQVD
mmetsp:Transcript_19711/g.48385  ORF Transcript_19711/g.48385 Transcript_19711/m.48385 type:complete len:316 (-) Transcript_19711:771-1718(-)|eukprot:CAMPEP_0206269546 /NCGR_PEP_ID=MMETSP0047_2-20121206/32353_1 /ASSEMBLY_ACC=CAM_ASM_000192 /TAXON_ID=195065 /ORGANISM="Chroomonas mesostigmatica_cf, Strain CCMP1168" /LENGTH=315 /DNA_ID=CAMNT_0053698049 /DNA_START=54 /DNA_END=1001 /DNA_ORIENTATION=+